MNVRKIIANAQDLHKSVGDDLVSLGGTLDCKGCGYSQPVESARLAHNLRYGWNCVRCGAPVRWVTAKEKSSQRGI